MWSSRGLWPGLAGRAFRARIGTASSPAPVPRAEQGEVRAPDLEATDEYRPAQADVSAPPASAPIPLAAADAPAAAKKPAAVQKTSVLGDFRLVARLGAGAMGTVYRARQISSPR